MDKTMEHKDGKEEEMSQRGRNKGQTQYACVPDSC